MKLNELMYPGAFLKTPTADNANKLSRREAIISYYEKAGPDYGTWSKGFNVHFGYFKAGMNPFNREAMLEKLNEIVFDQLQIDNKKPFNLADLGCGLGASLRYGATKFKKLSGNGVTIVTWQAKKAKELNSVQNYNIQIFEGDYCHTVFKDNSLDGVIAIESSCYASGSNKADLLTEIQRILKPGGRFVISDGFIKMDLSESGFLRKTYDALCKSWALTELAKVENVKASLNQLNFKEIEVRDISMRVAPSVAHVPFTVLYFLCREALFGKEKMTKERWDNLKSPLLTMILGLARQNFGYYLISGTK